MKKSIIDRINKRYNCNFPQDLDGFKLLVSKSNSILDLKKLTGYSNRDINYLLDHYGLNIVPKCLHCNKELHSESIGRAKRFCDDKCRYLYNKSIKTTTRICSSCGKEFTTTKENTSKYCSEECVTKIKRKCKWCGKEFIGSNYKKYCSSNCVRLASRYRVNYSKLTCEVCGKEYVGSKQKKYKYCSIECGDKFVSNRLNFILIDIFGTTDKNEIRTMVKNGVIKNG